MIDMEKWGGGLMVSTRSNVLCFVFEQRGAWGGVGGGGGGQ